MQTAASFIDHHQLQAIMDHGRRVPLGQASMGADGQVLDFDKPKVPITKNDTPLSEGEHAKIQGFMESIKPELTVLEEKLERLRPGQHNQSGRERPPVWLAGLKLFANIFRDSAGPSQVIDYQVVLTYGDNDQTQPPPNYTLIEVELNDSLPTTSTWSASVYKKNPGNNNVEQDDPPT